MIRRYLREHLPLAGLLALICIRRNWGRSEVLSCRFCPLFARFSPAF